MTPDGAAWFVGRAGEASETSSTEQINYPGRSNGLIHSVHTLVDVPTNGQLNDTVTDMKPRWDAERKELCLGNQLVKVFKWPSPNQETILAVFEEEGWPAKIDDPLPVVPDQCPKRRLHDTIKCLNRNQRVELIRFRGDGTGEGIIWTYLRDQECV